MWAAAERMDWEEAARLRDAAATPESAAAAVQATCRMNQEAATMRANLALWRASAKLDAAEIRAALLAGAEVDAQDEDQCQWAAVHYVCANKNVSCTACQEVWPRTQRDLAAVGCVHPVRTQTSHGEWVVLQMLSEYEKRSSADSGDLGCYCGLEALAALADAGANLSCAANFQVSPLQMAVTRGSTHMVSLKPQRRAQPPQPLVPASSRARAALAVRGPCSQKCGAGA